MAVDLSAAAGWYQKAAEKGNDGAQVALALMYLSGQGVEQDAPKAASWFAMAAAQGNARAQYNLALLTLQDSSRPCSAVGAEVRVFEGDGREIARHPGHAGSVLALAFSADGTLLASGGADATALVRETGRSR